MKFLYVEFEPVTFDSELFRQSVLLKINGARQLGHDVGYICYDRESIVSCVRGETKRIEFNGRSFAAENEFCKYVRDFLKEQTYDVLYIKGKILCPAILDIAKYVRAKKFGAKVIFEPGCYPEKDYFREMLQCSRDKGGFVEYAKTRRKLFRHKICLTELSQAVDTVVVFETPVNRLWGVAAIAVNNGIAVGQVRLRTVSEELDDPITILVVVDDLRICGLDRLFRGLNVYQHNRRHEQVAVDIVSGSDEKSKLKQMAERWNVGQFVKFLGEKSNEEINELCGTHTIAISDLGLFRVGKTYYSPRITRLYCAAGIPFVYAYEDVGLSGKVPFALKMPNLDAPISMELVGEFVWRSRLNTRLARQEHRFAEDNYDWRVIIKQILEFTATGKLEV